jgi:hypothetical protein
VNAADLSPADWEALVELRRAQLIRIDEAGRHAESLDRLAKAELIEIGCWGTDVADADVTDAQIDMGFKKRQGGQRADGREYCSAPHWKWPAFLTGYPDLPTRAPEMLCTHEGRRPVEIDWQDFCDWVELRLRRDEGWPKIAEIAAKYGHAVLDVVDWIDGRYWAGRFGVGALETQVVELDGE